MWKDPIVEEVRSVRERQAKRYGFDIRRIVTEARKRQTAARRRCKPPVGVA